MAGTVANLDTGSCWVSYGGADLGYTKGGVKISTSMETVNIEVDQEQNPIDVLIKTSECTVTVPIAEYTAQNLQLAFPGSTLAGSVLTLKDPMGTSLVSLAKALILHPKGLETSDKTKDWNFTKAVPVGNVEIVYDKENMKTINLTFKTFPTDGVVGTFGA